MIYLKLFSLISVSLGFLGLVAWVYLPRNKARFDDYGMIPLIEDTDKTEPASAAHSIDDWSDNNE